MPPRKSKQNSPAKKALKNAHHIHVPLTEKELTLRTRCIDTIRILAADMVERANSGHPGAPMGCAPIAYLLFGHIMNYTPTNPLWSNRDRFVLSNGHACALLYTLLHLTGYDLSLNDLKSFRQLGSKTPGHPENTVTPGVEVSTGPLGQGISNAVGLAIAEANLSSTFNRDGFNLVNHYTYVLCGDGCLQEGVSAEASSLAGHLGLGKLIVLYDDNRITIDGDTALSFTENVAMRYEAYGWQVITVEDVNEVETLWAAIQAAKEETTKPTLIKVRTVIGFGSTKAGTGGVHGSPLGTSDIRQAKQKFGFNPDESFVVEEEVQNHFLQKRETGQLLEAAWNQLFTQYKERYPELANEYTRRMKGELPENWEESIKNLMPVYSSEDTKQIATRVRSEEVLNACASLLPEMLGGSADLTPSNLTSLKCSGDFQKDTPAGRYIRYGVREHAMAAISNGLFAHGGLRPFCATFLNFIGYAMGSVRVSALSHFGVLYITTHDSIGLGEDGPTHQPVEMLECLRATPNILVIRPCDGNETIGAYKIALERRHTPTVLSLSRQGIPTLARTHSSSVYYGAYLLEEFSTPDHPLSIVLVSSGTEVSLTVDVAKQLQLVHALTVRVVSMPCWELFEEQSLDYQLSIFPLQTLVMSIEASGSHGWSKYAHICYGLSTYGLSAPLKDIYRHFGFTVENLVKKAVTGIEHYKKLGVVPNSLMLYPRFSAMAHTEMH